MSNIAQLKVGLAFGPLQIAGQFHTSVPQTPDMVPTWVVEEMQADPSIECIAVSRIDGSSVVYRNISHHVNDQLASTPARHLIMAPQLDLQNS